MTDEESKKSTFEPGDTMEILELNPENPKNVYADEPVIPIL